MKIKREWSQEHLLQASQQSVMGRYREEITVPKMVNFLTRYLEKDSQDNQAPRTPHDRLGRQLDPGKRTQGRSTEDVKCHLHRLRPWLHILCLVELGWSSTEAGLLHGGPEIYGNPVASPHPTSGEKKLLHLVEEEKRHPLFSTIVPPVTCSKAT